MEEIKKYIERRIKAFEADIQEYKESLNRNYERFFEWDAEEMYKVHKKMELYKNLLAAAEQGTLRDMLIHTIEHLKDDILFGDVQKRGSNTMGNILHTFNIEVKQDMLQRCRQLLNEIDRMNN